MLRTGSRARHAPWPTGRESTKDLELAPAGGPLPPAPSPAARERGRIRSRFGKLLSFSLPHAVVGEGRGGGRPPLALHSLGTPEPVPFIPSPACGRGCGSQAAGEGRGSRRSRQRTSSLCHRLTRGGTARASPAGRCGRRVSRHEVAALHRSKTRSTDSTSTPYVPGWISIPASRRRESCRRSTSARRMRSPAPPRPSAGATQ
jgi:hypothetical protein